jgi:vitamin B12 transporter
MSIRSIPFARTAAAVALLTTFNPIHAASIDDEAAIVVTATRIPTRINEVVADVTVIDREAIEQSGPAATLGDLLSGVPGVELSRQGGRGASEGVFIRGANSGHTLVLMDGQRVGSATLGQTAIDTLPVGQIERIEILRGPASALYGSDAIGGVIRITTRQGADAPRFDARAGIGSHGTQEVTLSHAGRVGAFDYAVRTGELRSTGVNAVTNPSSGAYNPDKDGFWRRHLALDATWRPDDATEAGVHWYDSDGMKRHDASWPTATADWQTRHEVSAFSAHARQRLTDTWTSEVRLGRGEDDAVTTPSGTSGQASDVYRTRQDQLAWQNDLRLPLGRGLVALESLRESVLSTKAYARPSRNTHSLVLGWNGSRGAHYWQVGARHDDNSQFGAKTTHALGYGFRFAPGWRASAGTGTSFKAPTMNDLYYPNTPFEGVGNPSLVPEEGRSHEIALHYADGRKEASLTAFRNDIRNLIQWEETAPGSWFYTPTNIGAARIGGLSAAGKLLFGEWALDGQLTLQSPKNRSNGEYLTRRATRYGALSLSRKHDRWSYGVELRFSGKRYDAPDFTTRRNTRTMGGYGIVHLRGEYRIDNQWSLFGRIDNLFDKQYELARSSTTNFASLGTTVFVGARFAVK